MTAVSLLFDEHVPPSIRNALLALAPGARVRIVGVDPDAPPKRTPDPDLLVFAEAERYALVTFDKQSMPGHVAAHLAAGRKTYGVFMYPHGFDLNPGLIAADLEFIVEASTPDEWIDRLVYLPL